MLLQYIVSAIVFRYKLIERTTMSILTRNDWYQTHTHRHCDKWLNANLPMITQTLNIFIACCAQHMCSVQNDAEACKKEYIFNSHHYTNRYVHQENKAKRDQPTQTWLHRNEALKLDVCVCVETVDCSWNKQCMQIIN